jgi:hypothetical protein
VLDDCGDCSVDQGCLVDNNDHPIDVDAYMYRYAAGCTPEFVFFPDLTPFVNNIENFLLSTPSCFKHISYLREKIL